MEEKLEKMVKLVSEMELEDPQTATKLAEVTAEDHKTKFDTFWSDVPNSCVKMSDFLWMTGDTIL